MLNFSQLDTYLALLLEKKISTKDFIHQYNLINFPTEVYVTCFGQSFPNALRQYLANYETFEMQPPSEQVVWHYIQEAEAYRLGKCLLTRHPLTGDSFFHKNPLCFSPTVHLVPLNIYNLVSQTVGTKRFETLVGME